MTKFLEQVADFILENVGDATVSTAVIFPNKRSEIFLKKYLKEKVKSNYWLPEFFTINEFIVNASGLTEAEPLNCYFELFKIHNKIAGSDARSLDDFLSWAPIMLADFNDIDLYLADAGEVFSNLSEAKAMQEWNLAGEPLTDLQKNYLSFYNSLHQYYLALNEKLTDKGLGYSGMLYRSLYKNIDQLSTQWKWDRFILVGFNALSLSEKKIFGNLIENYQTDVLFDVDEYYFSDKKSPIHEAGKFIKELIREWGLKDINWISNYLKTKAKNIKLMGVPKRIGQVKYTAQYLDELTSVKANDADAKNKLNKLLMDTAIILGDEKLLVPFLNSLPESDDENQNDISFNITMGYPLKNSSVAHFLLSWVEMLKSSESKKDNELPVRQLIKLISNPFFRLAADFYSKNHSQKIIEDIVSKNMMYLKQKEIIALAFKDNPETLPLFEKITSRPANVDQFFELFVDFIVSIMPVIKQDSSINGLISEQLTQTMLLVKKLKILFSKNNITFTLSALEKTLIQLLNRSEINLKGEPLRGIQVMGMLETRNLDFKNLVILSVNDGIIPKSDTIESFIPFDIRRFYKLPLPSDKTDIYAYHFYRLIQRAENIHLIYNSEADNFGGGEKSRFILQLENELTEINPNIKLNPYQIKIPVGSNPGTTNILVEKTDEVIKTLKEKLSVSLSPTALASFINCPLQFYFRYLLQLSPTKTLESGIEADVFGRVVHGVLEDLFNDFSGRPIKTDKLRLTDEKLSQLVSSKFEFEFPGVNLGSGQNLLIAEVAKQYINKYLIAEIKNLKREDRILISTEERLNVKLNISGWDVNLKGIIDRTDQSVNTGKIRVLDYKTGAVEKRDLLVKEWDELTNDPEKSKALQVLCYAYLFLKNKSLSENMEAGIVSLRKISNGFIALQLPEDESIADSMDIFEKLIKSKVEEIIDPTQPFSQTMDEKRCKWCDFRKICNRNPKSFF